MYEHCDIIISNSFLELHVDVTFMVFGGCLMKPIFANAKVVNLLIGATGIILILLAVIIGTKYTVSIILLSVGTSILATSIVSLLSSRYLIQQSKGIELVENWGLVQVYDARAEINGETNELLNNAKSLDICAMGLKGFRDAKHALIESRVSQGMRLRILTLSPNNPFLPIIDKEEGIAEGATEQTIRSLISWVQQLDKLKKYNDQIEIRFYDNYPYEFYFCIDGVVFTGPYQPKTSQQTITYKYRANSYGAQKYDELFNYLWDNKGRRIIRN